jgi:hypothetical protein
MGNSWLDFIGLFLPLFLFLWWTWRAKWGKEIAPTVYYLWAILLLKTAVGMVYLEWHHRTFGVCDSDAYLRTIQIFNGALPHHIGHYLQFLVYPGGEYLPPDLWYYIKHTRFWSDKGMMLFIKVLSICSLLGGGKVVWIMFWYNVVGMLGPVYLLKRLTPYFDLKLNRRWLLVFLIPQVLFWGSGLHKEGFIISMQCFVFGAFIDLAQLGSWKRIFKNVSLYTFLLAWSVLLLIRGFDAIVIALVLVLYLVRSWQVLLYSFALLIAALLLSEWLNLGVGNFLVQKQQAYLHNGVVVSVQQVLALDGHSVWSFVRNIPMALIFSLVGMPGLVLETVYFVFQLLCVSLLAVLLIRHTSSIWIWRFISIALLQLTFIGWVVTNQGSVVRYASIPWFWLGLSMVCLSLRVKRK